MRRRPRGFTLLELLIVIVIISILSSILLYGIHAAIVAARESSSEGMVKAMSGALGSYKSQYGAFPPTSLDRFRVRLPNETNNGIEALVACVSTKNKGGPFYQPPDENLYSNADKDKADRNVTNWFFGDNELREISDNFGNCLFYIHHVDYESPKKEHLAYLPYEGAKKSAGKVFQSKKTKTYSNPGKYQLISPGRDEKFGTPDDIRGW
jgi:prepilin-type N-terminal cleavage/methylation domain-containing protein